MINYKKYVGQYVKRFYTPFKEENIFYILDYRVKNYAEGSKKCDIPEFLYADNERQRWWTDVEDSVIITNEMPIVEDERIANVNHPDYNGYNPFAKTTDTEKRLVEELSRIDASKKRNAKVSEESYIAWQKDNIAKVGRAHGYRITVLKSKLKQVYQWLFS